MTPMPERHGDTEPASRPTPKTEPTQGLPVPGARWLRALAVVAIGLLLALSSGLLLVQREATLERAQAQAQREVQRLAAELEQSLRLAQASIAATGTSPASRAADLLSAQRPLVDSLSLPFSLRQLDAGALGSKDLPAAQWQPELAQQAGAQWVVPLRWRQPAAEGGQIYQVDLPRDALLSRFASEGLPAGGSMSLFRLEDDGATTVLVRHPLVPQEQGLTVRGHLTDAVRQASSGVFDATAQIDGVRRIVGFQRLAGSADRLVIVYALSVQSVLAEWAAILPLAAALTLLVAAAMAYGAWRLDRSMQALARSERHFQTLSDHLPDVFVRYDASGRVLYANPAVETATGIPAQAMLGRTLEQFGAPSDVAALWRTCLQRVAATGEPEILYFTHTGPRGERHWEAQASLEPVAAGAPVTTLVISRDITARREAEARQHSAQKLFETVFQAAPEAMSLTDWSNSQLLLVNDAFCTLFGRSREQLIGQSAIELRLWQSPSERQQLIERLERGEQVRNAAASSTRPDGQTIQVRYSAERVQQDGEQRLLLMFRDVTQLESDQRTLERSEQRFRLAAAHGQVWEWDFGRGFIQPSDEFFVAMGHPSPPADQMGARFLELIHPEDLPRLQQVLRRFFKGEGDYRLEFRARDAQGRDHWFDTRGSGLRDASGHVTYMAGTTFEISDRKALEEAQRQTLKHLDTVANASAALAWTVDAQQKPDWLNQAWLDFTGRDLRSECDAPWLDDVHPQDRERCAQVFNSAFAARQPYSMEYRLRRHDGEYRWLHEQGRPRYDADQRFIGYVGSCLDVTELRRAEAVAMERSAILEQVFGVIQDMLFVLDGQERFVFFQAGAEERLYRRPEDFLGRPMAEVLPPALVPPLRAAIQRARESGVQELDYSMDLPVGTHFFNARLAWLPGGDQCMFVVRDTSEQQAVARARTRLNDFVLLLFRLASRFINLPVQQMDEAIDAALKDMGVFVGADRAYLFAYDPQAGTSTNTHEWCAPGIAPQKPLWQNAPIGRLTDWHQMHLRGEKVMVADREALPASALRDVLQAMDIRGLLTLPLMNGTDCLGFVGLDSVHQPRAYGSEEITLLELFAQMLVNLSLRAQAAAQVREMTEQLEQKVEERTQQLHESVQRLQTVNRELESFTYSASHDLRTPLRGIEGFSALLLDEHAAQLDDQGREYLQRIQRATLHMSQLVNDLLAYSHLQQLAEQIEPVALAACAQTVAAPFRDELEARQGQLSVLIPDDLRVQANPKGLAIVLRNLIDNALKFTPAGQAPRVRVEAHAVGDRLHLSVSDQGIGFDMRHHDRIFGMFQRLHRQDQIPGTGIGLALVQKAVERMGGQIRAESTPGHGATFRVDLPLA
ncbi:PAS domain S-box protein [Hydrogenophaga sp. MI9]|uniref:PAS domain S-box protein n=1 Tax=Hydrogenophaga sp. MI9 TaxID=3453719 RepID=UPI003EEDF34C